MCFFHFLISMLSYIRNHQTVYGEQCGPALMGHGASDGGTCGDGWQWDHPPSSGHPPPLLCTPLPHPESNYASSPGCSFVLLVWCGVRGAVTAGSPSPVAQVAQEPLRRLQWQRPSCSGCCGCRAHYRAHSHGGSRSGGPGCIWRRSGGACGTSQSPRQGRHQSGRLRGPGAECRARSVEAQNQGGGGQGQSHLCGQVEERRQTHRQTNMDDTDTVNVQDSINKANSVSQTGFYS